MTPIQRILGLAVLASSMAIPGALPAVGLFKAAIPLFELSSFARKQIERNALVAARIEIPKSLRHENWGGGSCVHASTVHLLHWQGQHDIAEQWRRTHSGGSWPESLDKDLDKAGINYAQTTTGEAKFLDWAIRTRRGANVTVSNAAHMVTLIGLDDKQATILDSNEPNRPYRQPREKFLADWRSGSSGGWAFTTLFPPPPPKPWALKTENVR